MAQKQFTTFQAEILSFELREALLGIARPGRYSGYDVLAADGAPAGGNILLALSHSSAGVQKLAKLGGSLGSPIGVAVTTQGTVIHEDDTSIDIDIPDNTGSSYERWHVIYIEHDYVEVQGANNATYGFISAAFDDSGSPMAVLTETYHRVPIGYIRVDALGADISDLTYWPAESLQNFGDSDMADLLFGATNGFLNTVAELGAEVGAVPAAGVIGARRYQEENYIADGESLSASIEALDVEMNNQNVDITALGNRLLDSWATASDSTTLDATITEHGLLPKLSGVTSEFLRGDGAFAVPPGGKFVMRTGAFGSAITLDVVDPDTGTLPLVGVGGVPADADVLILSIEISTAALPPGATGSLSLRAGASGGYNGVARATNTSDAASNSTHSVQVMVPCNSSQLLYYNMANKTYCTFYITLVGWQTYTA